MKTKILIVCVHNSARSQMAEEFFYQLGKDKFEVDSAGLKPGKLNPLAVDVMKEIGYDISHKTTDSVFEFFKEGRRYTHIIKMCKQSHGERCPIFPGVTQIFEWEFDDPYKFSGTHEEKLEKTRKVRDNIRLKVEKFIQNSNIE